MVPCSSMFSQFFFWDLEARKQTWQNHGRLRLRHRCCRCGRWKVTVKYPGSLLIYWLSMVQWYHILSHIYIYIYPCSYIWTMWHHHFVSIVASTCHPLPLCHPFCPPGRNAGCQKSAGALGALERWQGWHPWPLKHAHWDGTFWKLGFSSFGLLVLFSQGIFGNDPLANY